MYSVNHHVEFYPVDNVLQPSNNWGQYDKYDDMLCIWIYFIADGFMGQILATNEHETCQDNMTE